jgi:hypothetical protein
VILLHERVVPEPVDADARVEPELDERDGRESDLVIRSEREEVLELLGDLAALGGDRDRSEWAAQDVLAREVEW